MLLEPVQWRNHRDRVGVVSLLFIGYVLGFLVVGRESAKSAEGMDSMVAFILSVQHCSWITSSETRRCENYGKWIQPFPEPVKSEEQQPGRTGAIQCAPRSLGQDSSL